MFIVLMATVRDKKTIAPAVARLWETSTHPTDMLILDGSAGKMQTLNMYRKLYCSEEQSYYHYVVTIDDDVLVPPGWQDDCVDAHEIAGLSAIGLDLSHTEGGAAYMSEVNAIETFTFEQCSVQVRPVNRINIGGAFICMPVEMALRIPAYQCDSAVRYQIDEDSYRCSWVRKVGAKLGYVICRQGAATLLSYDDPQHYKDMKLRDEQYVRNVKGVQHA